MRQGEMRNQSLGTFFLSVLWYIMPDVLTVFNIAKQLG